MLWVWIAFAAGCVQTARNAFSRSLVGQISPTLNSWSRFAFMLPLAFPLVAFFVAQSGVPYISLPCFLYGVLGAVGQLFGGIVLIIAFQRSNFAQSIIFHKLELVFAALIGALLFRELPSLIAWLGILVCGLGIVFMNIGRDAGPDGWRRAFHLDQGSVLAILCGVSLACSSFMIKLSVQAFLQGNPSLVYGTFEGVVMTVFLVTAIEVWMLSMYLLLCHPSEFQHVRRLWPRMLMIGATSLAGSLGWFWAFSLTLVAYVKAVGQIELVLSVLIGVMVWREYEIRRQIPGTVLLIAGMLLVLLG